MERRAAEAALAAKRERLEAEQRAWAFIRSEQEKLAREEQAAAEAAAPHTFFAMRLLAGRTLTLDSVPFPAGGIEIPAAAKPFLNELPRYPRLCYELGPYQ